MTSTLETSAGTLIPARYDAELRRLRSMEPEQFAVEPDSAPILAPLNVLPAL